MGRRFRLWCSRATKIDALQTSLDQMRELETQRFVKLERILEQMSTDLSMLNAAVENLRNTVAAGFEKIASEIGETAVTIASLKSKIADTSLQAQIDEVVEKLNGIGAAASSSSDAASAALDALQEQPAAESAEPAPSAPEPVATDEA